MNDLKKYWTVSEVAELCQVKPSAIRYYLKYFDIRIRKRTRAGARRFTREELERVKEIAELAKIYRLEYLKENMGVLV